jgi:hypothetical protein
VGKIDNAQELAILAADGYMVDEEFKDLAGIIMKIKRTIIWILEN